MVTRQGQRVSDCPAEEKGGLLLLTANIRRGTQSIVSFFIDLLDMEFTHKDAATPLLSSTDAHIVQQKNEGVGKVGTLRCAPFPIQMLPFLPP